MTTLEEMARTICLAIWNFDYTPRDPKHPDGRWVEAMNAARAVLEKHVGKMLAEAYLSGVEVGDRPMEPMQASTYAARIIAQLTKQNERTG